MFGAAGYVTRGAAVPSSVGSSWTSAACATASSRRRSTRCARTGRPARCRGV